MQYKGRLGGGCLLLIAAGLLERFTSHAVPWAVYIWLLVASFVVALIVHGASQHKRLMPRIVIRNLRHRVWTRSAGGNGVEYWFEVFNPSSSNSLDLVRAEMVSITPDPYGYLPLPLHVKHDPTYEKREFSVDPGAVGMVDLLTGPADHKSGQKGLIIPHTISKEWGQMPPRDYVFTVRARDVAPEEARFRAWVGEDGALKCVQL